MNKCNFVLTTACFLYCSVNLYANIDSVSACLDSINYQTSNNMSEALLIEQENILKRLCGEAERSLSYQKSDLQSYNALVATIKRKTAFNHITQLHAEVNQELEGLRKLVVRIYSAPKYVNSSNNAKWRDIGLVFLAQRDTLHKLQREWEDLHHFRNHPELSGLYDLINSRNSLPSNLDNSARNFLDKLPPYMFGREKPPRERLVKYTESLNRVEEFYLKEHNLYVDSVTGNLHKAVQEETNIFLNQLEVSKYILLLQKNVGSSLSISKEAINGLCLNPLEKAKDSLLLLSIGQNDAPLDAQAQVKRALSKTVAGFERILTLLSDCDYLYSLNRVMQMNSNYLRTTETTFDRCVSKNSARKLIVDGIKRKLKIIEAHRRDHPSDKNTFIQSQAENIWYDLELINKQCSRIR